MGTSVFAKTFLMVYSFRDALSDFLPKASLLPAFLTRDNGLKQQIGAQGPIMTISTHFNKPHAGNFQSKLHIASNPVLFHCPDSSASFGHNAPDFH